MGIIIRQSIKGTIVTYIGTFIGFLSTFYIAAKFLTPEEIGLTKIFLDMGMLFAGLAQLGTTASVLRYYPYFKNPEKKDNGFFFWSLIIPFIGFIIFLILYLLLKGPIMHYYAHNSSLFLNYYYYVIPLAFFMLYISVFETNANVLMRIVVPRFIREVAIRVLTIIVYLLYAFNFVNLDGMMTLYTLVYGIAALLNIMYLFSLQKISLKPNLQHITKWLRKDFLFYTSFLITAALGGTLAPKIDTFMISGELGLSYTGLYTIAFYMAAVVEVPYRSLGAISLPHISQMVKENNLAETNKLCKSVSLHQLLAGSFIFLLIWINIDVIFQLIPNGKFYASGKWVVFYLGLSRLLYSSFNVALSVLSYSKYYYFSLIFTFLLTGLTIFTNLWLIPIFGITGSAIASLASYVVYFIVVLLLIYRKTKTNPFSLAQLKVVGIIVTLYLISLIWISLPHPLLDGIIKTAVICIIGFILVYYTKVSVEVNNVAKIVYNKIKGKR